MALSFVGAQSSGNAGSVTSFTPTFVAGVLEGDLMLAFVHRSNTTNDVSETGVGGWTKQTFIADGAFSGLTFLTKVAGASEAGPTFSWAAGSQVEVSLVVYRGQDATFFDVAVSTAGGLSATSITLPSLTTTTANAWYVAGVGVFGGTYTHTFTLTNERADANNGLQVGTAEADQAFAAIGATGTFTDTFSATVSGYGRVVFALRELAIVAPDPSLLRVPRREDETQPEIALDPTMSLDRPEERSEFLAAMAQLPTTPSPGMFSATAQQEDDADWAVIWEVDEQDRSALPAWLSTTELWPAYLSLPRDEGAPDEWGEDVPAGTAPALLAPVEADLSALLGRLYQGEPEPLEEWLQSADAAPLLAWLETVIPGPDTILGGRLTVRLAGDGRTVALLGADGRTVARLLDEGATVAVLATDGRTVARLLPPLRTGAEVTYG